MNEAVDQVADQAEAAVVCPHQPSAGALIRQARESVGLHIAALAVALKVPVKRLEALEADRLDLLPDAVFARALAGSVCRALKIDAAPILALLPSKEAPRLGDSNGNFRQVYRAPVSSPRLVTWPKPSRAAVLGGAGLVLCALALLILPPVDWSGSKADAVEVATNAVPVFPAATASNGASAAAPAELVNELVVKPAGAAPTGAQALPSEKPATVSLSAAQTLQPGASPAAPVTTVSAVAAPPAVQASGPVKPPAAGIVVFKPTAESWVEVSDARGVVLIRRLLAGGEVAGVSGALPLTALVGRADVTRVQVRGQSLDLSPMTQNNVARFEVK